METLVQEHCMHTFSNRCLPGSPIVLLIFAIVSYKNELSRTLNSTRCGTVQYTYTFGFSEEHILWRQNCELSKFFFRSNHQIFRIQIDNIVFTDRLGGETKMSLRDLEDFFIEEGSSNYLVVFFRYPYSNFFQHFLN